MGQAREYLSLSGEPAKSAGVEDAGAVAREGRAVGMRLLGMLAGGECAKTVDGNFFRQQTIHSDCETHSVPVLVWLYRRTASAAHSDLWIGAGNEKMVVHSGTSKNVFEVTNVKDAQCYRILPATGLDNYRGSGVLSCRF